MTRADSHNNPTAFTVAIARQAGLKEGTQGEFIQGDPFPNITDPNDAGQYTARLIGDPIALTIRVIDSIGFYTKGSQARWNYIAIPREAWLSLSYDFKAGVIYGMYNREGGVTMRPLFSRHFIF